MSAVIIGLQCQLDSPSPAVPILCQMVSSLQSSMSSTHSLCGLPLLFFPSMTPNITVLRFLSSPMFGDMSKQAHFPPYCFLQDLLFSINSTEYCVSCYFLCPFNSRESSVTLAFECQ